MKEIEMDIGFQKQKKSILKNMLKECQQEVEQTQNQPLNEGKSTMTAFNNLLKEMNLVEKDGDMILQQQNGADLF